MKSPMTIKNLVVLMLLLLVPVFVYAASSSKKQEEKEVKAEQEKELKAKNEAIDFYNQGRQNYKDGQKETAISNFSKAIELFPEISSDAYYFRGHLYAEMGKNDEAIADFSKTIEMTPEYKEAYAEGAIYTIIRISTIRRFLISTRP